MSSRVCGVYSITNTVNGKVYVGSSANMYKRWETHLQQLRRGVHHSRHLQHAFALDGEHSFEFEVLAECLPEELLGFEQFYIDACLSHVREFGYNLSPTAGSTRGIKRPWRPKSEEHKRKIAEAHVGMTYGPETRAKLSAAAKGRVVPIEVRRKISQSTKGIAKSDETRKRMSEGMRKSWEKRKARETCDV